MIGKQLMCERREKMKEIKMERGIIAGKLESKQTLLFGSVPFFIFFNYVVFIWMTELWDLICFIAGFRQATIISRVVIVILWISTLSLLKVKRKFLFEKSNYNLVMVFVCIGILLFGFLKGIMPDLSYDTGNYHLLAQEPGFVNWFEENGFAAGHFQVWGFRLSDRIVYPFRRLLGYRMGTLFSSIVLMISYLQVVQILKGMQEDFGYKKNIRCRLLSPEAFAVFLILGQDCLTAFGSYYVDVNAFPIALEVVRLLLKAGTRKICRNEIVYFAWLNGFWVAFKMTNIVFCVPAIVIFILFVKKIDARVLLLSIAGCVVPCMVYLSYNYICTKNPVFPYFNAVFESPYFGIANFSDKRWGGQNLFEKIFWLIFAVFFPGYRQCEISNPCTIIYAGGFLSAVWFVREMLLNKIRKKPTGKFCYVELLYLSVISSVLWGTTTGIQRYYSFGMLLLGIICYNGVCCLYTAIQKRWAVYLILFLFIVGACYQSCLVINGREWAWRKVTAHAVKENVGYLFKDKEGQASQKIKDVEVFLITYHPLCGFAHFLNQEAEVFNLSYKGCLKDRKQVEFEQAKEELFKRRVYDLVRVGYDKETYSMMLAENGLAVYSEEELETQIGKFVLIELVKRKDG